MQFINKQLYWTNNTTWAWPVGDTELLRVFYQVNDIDQIIKYVPEEKKSICIQAGGACGMWPLRFSNFFREVYTFEPVYSNYECLLKNTDGIRNIFRHNLGLSDAEKTIEIKYEKNKENNHGSGYGVESTNGDIKTITIDSLSLPYCGLIQLDVEGMELDVLKGAYNTILKHKPVICLEVKMLPHMERNNIDPLSAVLWLQNTFNYRPIFQINRDVILIP